MLLQGTYTLIVLRVAVGLPVQLLEEQAAVLWMVLRLAVLLGRRKMVLLLWLAWRARMLLLLLLMLLRRRPSNVRQRN